MKKILCLCALSTTLLAACQSKTNENGEASGRTHLPNLEKQSQADTATNVELVPADSIAR